MRKLTTAIAAAAAAVMTAGAAPAMACEGYASPCGACASYVSPCAQGGYGGYGYGDYGNGYAESYQLEHLPDPTVLHPHVPAEPRYYYVNQGLSYTGPGMYAPVPSYQERAVTGWHGYDYGYYYGYNGGPYGDATTHYYDGMPRVQGPTVYRYGPWAHHHYHHHSLRYGYAHPAMRYAAGPHVGHYGPRIVHVPHRY
jgi:hypothetical protein